MIKFSIIVSDTSRSIEYLRQIKYSNLKPEYIIYLQSKKKNKYSKKLNKSKFFFPKINAEVFKTKIVNNKVSKFILNNKIKNIIYSGYPGIIIRDKYLLNKKNLIHSHPGKLPEYKGSTTIYYSMLKENKIFCTTFVLNPKIDSGKILLINEYSIPKNIKIIDNEYDDKIRAKNIVQVLQKNQIFKNWKNNNKTLPYYVIHPILRSFIFMRKTKNFNLKHL